MNEKVIIDGYIGGGSANIGVNGHIGGTDYIDPYEGGITDGVKTGIGGHRDGKPTV